MSKKYRGFLIDADNTIFDYDRAEKEALFEVLKDLGYTGLFETAQSYFSKINTSLWQAVESREITINQIKTRRFAELLPKLGLSNDPDKIASHYLDILSQKAYLIPNSVAVLEKLSKQAVISMITNGLAYVQRGRIARSEIEVFFNDIIISEEIGFSKPDPQFFQKAIKSLYLPVHEILCIGDSLSADIKGGQNAGLDTCWFNQKNEAVPSYIDEPTYIINNLKQLESFLPPLS
ncbi:MAG: YjjG family noncanonical pyrimidine nucleotidase [Spirochaetales bacterium]|nr:YjjG family noncanonical pyrimidine nucleotidase [Spirochaetales bacterium]